MSVKLPIESLVQINDGQTASAATASAPLAAPEATNYGEAFGRRIRDPLAAGAPMTFERFKTIAESIDLRMLAMPIEIKVDDDIARMTVKVCVRYHAPDIKDGRTTPIESRQLLPWVKAEKMSDHEAVEYLYTQIKSAVLHELDESFLVCGKRVFDPHWYDETYNGRPAFYLGDRPEFKLPDPLPPPLPRNRQFPPDARRIEILGFKAPAPKLFREWKDGETPEPIAAFLYEYLPTGELVGEPKPDRTARSGQKPAAGKGKR
jgi:hypothetical protein